MSPVVGGGGWITPTGFHPRHWCMEMMSPHISIIWRKFAIVAPTTTTTTSTTLVIDQTAHPFRGGGSSKITTEPIICASSSRDGR